MNEPNHPLRLVVVGGVAGGASAAARARRCNANADITILEKGPAVSFANCGLPYHLGGEIEDRNKLLIATAELFWNRFRIRVQTGHHVTSIDRDVRTVSGCTSDGQQFQMPYDRLILATGSEPVRPGFCKVEADNLFQLWTLDDMDRILASLKDQPCKRATVIGAGFVGLEVVEQLVRRGLSVSLIERLPQVLGALDPEMAKLLEVELSKHQVDLQLGASVEKLLMRDRRITGIQLADGRKLDTDLVIVGAGVKPRIELAVQAGLVIGDSGGVTINEFCQTNDPNIYAVGDMVEYHHGTLDVNCRVPLAGPANRAGRVAGTHAAGGAARALGSVQGTAIVRVFDLAAGTTGLNEQVCEAAGIVHRSATIQAPHHASYFPGAKNLTLKIIYAPTGKLLGAQAVGAEGVDKRIDVVASLLHFGGTIDDLASLDLAYAPPFGSAKDPVHMAAFVAQNDLDEAPQLVEFDADLTGLQVVDVRNAGEFAAIPLLGDAIHIPVDVLHDRCQELDKTRPTVTVCHSGKRAHVAACLLQGRGFSSVQNLNGGMSLRQLSD